MASNGSPNEHAVALAPAPATSPGRRVDVSTLVRLGVPLQDVGLSASRAEEFTSRQDDETSDAMPSGTQRLLVAVPALVDVLAVSLIVLASDIGNSLGMGTSLVGLAALFGVLASAGLGFVASARLRRPDIRLTAVVVCLAAAPVLLVATALAASGGVLVLATMGHAAAVGIAGSTVLPLIANRELSPSQRIQAVVTTWGARIAGAAVALVLIGLLSGPFNLTWRACLLILAVIEIPMAVLVAVRLRPLAATWREGRAERNDATLGGFERIRRIRLIATARRAMTGGGVVGVFAAMWLVYGLAVLERRQSMDFQGRALVMGVMALLGVIAGVMVAVRATAEGDDDGAAVLSSLAGRVLVGASVAAIFAPVLADGPLFFLLLIGGAGTLVIAAAALTSMLLEAVPRSTQAVALAMTGVFFGPVGVLGGLLLVSSIDRRFGPAVAFSLLVVPGLLLSRAMRQLGLTRDYDVEQTRIALVEEAELLARREAGMHVPMLTCRSIDFSYGQLQVLFGVDFTVDEGEMVALLGTNGAGKSTLLRVISGLGLPGGGRVHFGGEDITYLDPERRVTHGISQIPGGKAVFGPMSVVENLRVFGHALGRSGADLDAGIEATLGAFPRLEERRNQLASTLSGGEQQMLALGKALILKPRLLLIDELSLGLAPIIVGQLLEMVRSINAEGTAVVLVEQSVNVALSLVQHAYFMEKGQIRFDGKASELLHRRDLLRSVFLEGVDKGGV